MIIQPRDPFSGEYPITQGFGAKYWYLGIERTHYGVDFACPKGTPIIAVADGQVGRCQYALTGYGKNVTIDHNSFDSFYAHLDSIMVHPGQNISAGTIIGYSGRSGFTLGKTGYHLHFGMTIDGVWVDPLPYLTGEKEAPEPEAPAEPSGERTYTIKRGDSLWKIAQEFYGDGNRWPEIFEANRDTIDDANLIFPGNQIRIP